MHILYILDFYKPNTWWIEILLDEIINHFWKNNKISVITWNFNNLLPEVEKKWNITIYRVKAKNLISYVLNWYKKWKQIIKDVDIIHWNSFYSWLISSKLAKKFNKKSILHVHGFFGNFRNYLLEWNYIQKKIKVLKFKLLEKLNTKWHFDKFIAVSKFTEDVLRFYYWIKWEKLELVYNWLDYEKWKQNINSSEVEKIQKQYNLKENFSILFIWRIEKVKWYNLLLESLANIKNTKINVIMIIYGDFKKFEQEIRNLWAKNIEYENNIIKKFSLNKIEINILNWMEHNKLANYIKAVSAVVFPSFTESFGYVWLETSIIWTPIIVSDNWAIPEVVFWKVKFFSVWNINELISILKETNWIKYEQIPYKNFCLKNTLKNIENIYLGL